MDTDATINTALTERGLLPIDGKCTCDRCGKAGLGRDQIQVVGHGSAIVGISSEFGSGFCMNCIDLFWAYHDAKAVDDVMHRKMAMEVNPVDPCRTCNGTGRGRGSRDRINHCGEVQFASNECWRCNGTGEQK